MALRCELADSVLHSFVARIYSSHTLLLPAPEASAVSACLQLQVQGLFRVCLVAWSISELLSLLIQAEMRFLHVFGSLGLLRQADFRCCLVSCRR
jgi:hypothetical protein